MKLRNVPENEPATGAATGVVTEAATGVATEGVAAALGEIARPEIDMMIEGA
jgi:hypothetical protein